jgi:hypothetical protein
MIAVEGAMKRVCCVCRRVEQDGQWLKNPVSAQQRVSHVYCPLCYEDLMDEIDRYALQKWNKSVYTIMNAGQSQGV